MRLTLRGPVVTSDAQHGDSIAVNGCCLTVTDLDGDAFTADVMAESLTRTSLGDLSVGSPVNLERAVAAGARLGGHIVQGHVDGVGTLPERTPSEHWDVLRFSLPAELARYVVEKGSITVSGVSLTVVEVVDERRPLLGLTHPDHARGHHPRHSRPGRPGQPGGRHRGQVRRTSAHTEGAAA